jgi:hypothetical protein
MYFFESCGRFVMISNVVGPVAGIYLLKFIAAVGAQAKGPAFAAAWGTAVEVLFPGSAQSLLSRVRGTAFWIVYIALAPVITLVSSTVIKLITPLFRIDLSETGSSDNVVQRF